MINTQWFTKTAHIGGVSNNRKGTNTNRIVLACRTSPVAANDDDDLFRECNASQIRPEAGKDCAGNRQRGNEVTS